jgi:hypothetical protein
MHFDFLPISLGIETLGGIFTPIVLRGTPLPAKRQQNFSTAKDNQPAVSVKIYIGERPIAKSNLLLKEFELSGIPPAPKGQPEIVLSIEIGKDLSIKAKAVELKSKINIMVEEDTSSLDLTNEKITKMLKDAEENKANDDKSLRLMEEDNKRQSLIQKAEEILGDVNKRKSYDANKIEKLIAEIGLSIQNNELDKVNSKTKELEGLIQHSGLYGGFSGFGDIFQDFFAPQKIKPDQTSSSKQTASSHPKEKLQTNKTVRDERPIAEPMKYDIGKIFGGYNFTLDPNLCFVLMPFVKEMDPIYTDHIKPAVESEGIACQRADEIVGTNIITFDIWEKINRSRIIIADLTNMNPNVFYEIGLAHALGKEVILIAQTMNDVPFDLKSLRCIVYSFTPRGMKELETTLVKTIQIIMRSS